MFKLRPDIKKIEIALVFIVMGVSLRLALAHYPNFEPVIAISLLAGIILGGYYAFFVPLIIMALSDWAIYMLYDNGVFGLGFILSISFFTWSGMMFAGIIGARFKPRFLYRMKTVAVFTGIGILATLIFDAWAMLGWHFISGVPILTVLGLQVEFTIRHLFSTLIFVPLLTTMYIYIHEYGLPRLNPFKREIEEPEDKLA